jgi:transcriptional regulator with XRE-family HTH domain
MRGDEIHMVGRRIREIRLSKSLKLIETAATAGVSKGLLSRIENGRTIPSLPVLFSIIQAITENPSSFFEKMNFSIDSPFYIHLTEKDYEPIQKEDSTGFHYFSIVSRSFSQVTFHAVLLNLEPDATRDTVTTDGMELIYLISGSIEYLLGKEILFLEEGDSLFFDGRVPHLKINHSGKQARILVIYLMFNH